MSLAGAVATCSVLFLLLLRTPVAEGQSSETTSEAFVMEDILSKNGCGAFAGLIAATAAAGDAFGAQIAGDDGLTIFCPDDDTVAAFGPGRFGNLTADGQVALLLYHGVATLYSEKALRAMLNTKVTTLTNGPGDHDIHIFGGTDIALVSPPLSAARVTKMVVDNDRLAVYLIDSVLVPGPGEPSLVVFRLWKHSLLVTFCTFVGLLALLLLLFGLLLLVPWLKRTYQYCATAHARSTARVAPDG